MRVDGPVIEAGLAELGLADKDVAVHSSLGSFGHVTGALSALTTLRITSLTTPTCLSRSLPTGEGISS